MQDLDLEIDDMLKKKSDLLKNTVLSSSKFQNRWVKLMCFGRKLGCHQMPERSFFIEDYQLPVCAR